MDPNTGGTVKSGLYFTHITSSGSQSWEIAPFKWSADFIDEIDYLSLTGSYLWGCGKCPSCNLNDDNGLVSRLKVSGSTAPAASDLIAA